MSSSGEEAKELWLFGYGSLIWKPPPHYDLRVPGSVKGYVRRFWQASEDHRGTPESPGRVVTLIEHSYWASLGEKVSAPEPDQVYGTAYRIPPEHVEEVKQYLDIREINGYSVQYTTFFPLPIANLKASDADPRSRGLPSHRVTNAIAECLVYIGLPDNPQFLGLQDPEDIAGVIARSTGPSGKNDEYLFMLEQGLETLHVDHKNADEHVSDLVARVKRINQEGRLG